MSEATVPPPLLSGVVFRLMSEVIPQRVTWLWPGRLPAGKLVVLDGDPSLGKSTITLDWAARVSTGSRWPDGALSPGAAAVVLLSAEDGAADTIRPRLEAAGADLDRVGIFDAVKVEDDNGSTRERPPSIPADLDRLEALISRDGAGLAVVDPLAAFLGSNVDSYRDTDVRAALMPMAKVAERTGATIVVVRHLSKSGGTNAIYRGGGSIGIMQPEPACS